MFRERRRPGDGALMNGNGQGASGTGSIARTTDGTVRKGDFRPVRALIPSATTLLFLGIAGASFWLLGQGEGSVVEAAEGPWAVWKGTAAVTLAVSVLLFPTGIVCYVRECRDSGDGGWVWAHLVVASLAATGAIVGGALAPRPSRDWVAQVGIEHMGERLDWTTSVITASAVPWLAAVWLAHRNLHIAREHASMGGDHLGRLRATWDTITACGLAFAAFVVIAVLPTGALRNVWLAGPALADQFPPSDVVLYGAAYGVLAFVLILPLIFVWRAAANTMVWFGVQTRSDLTAAKDEEMTRLERALHVDGGALRNPLTLLTLLTPLATAALAVYLPKLGS